MNRSFWHSGKALSYRERPSLALVQGALLPAHLVELKVQVLGLPWTFSVSVLPWQKKVHLPRTCPHASGEFPRTSGHLAIGFAVISLQLSRSAKLQLSSHRWRTQD